MYNPGTEIPRFDSRVQTFNKGLQFPAIASNSITTIDQASTSSYKGTFFIKNQYSVVIDNYSKSRKEITAQLNNKSHSSIHHHHGTGKGSFTQTHEFNLKVVESQTTRHMPPPPEPRRTVVMEQMAWSAITH